MPPIDTLKAARRLQEDGTFSPEQAERIAEVLADADAISVTKADLDETESRLSARFDERFTAIDTHINNLEVQLNARIDNLESKFEERFTAIDDRFALMDERFAMIDERFAMMNKRFESLEATFDARLQAQSEQLSKQLEQMQTRLLQWMIGGFGAVAAIVSLLNYLFG